MNKSSRIQKINQVISKLNNVSERRKQNVTYRFKEGSYYRINVRDRDEFIQFKSETPTGNNTIQQINGKRADGIWCTQSWLIKKEAAHIESDKLIADKKAAKKLLQVLDGKIHFVEGDIFQLVD